MEFILYSRKKVVWLKFFAAKDFEIITSLEFEKVKKVIWCCFKGYNTKYFATILNRDSIYFIARNGECYDVKFDFKVFLCSTIFALEIFFQKIQDILATDELLIIKRVPTKEIFKDVPIYLTLDNPLANFSVVCFSSIFNLFFHIS